MKNIEHKGIVVDSGSGYLNVKIECHSACSACQAKSVCGESKDKIIRIPNDDLQNLRIGDNVIIKITDKQGMAAVLISYLVPFFIFMLSLIVMLTLKFSEILSALLSTAFILVYYLIVYLLRNKIDRHFKFDVEKI